MPAFDLYKVLVNELRRKRRELGLSQEDVAAAAGLADGHLNKLETFARVAQIPTLQLWAQTVGLEISLTAAQLPAATERAIQNRTSPLRSTKAHYQNDKAVPNHDRQNASDFKPKAKPCSDQRRDAPMH